MNENRNMLRSSHRTPKLYSEFHLFIHTFIHQSAHQSASLLISLSVSSSPNLLPGSETKAVAASPAFPTSGVGFLYALPPFLVHPPSGLSQATALQPA